MKGKDHAVAYQPGLPTDRSSSAAAAATEATTAAAHVRSLYAEHRSRRQDEQRLRLLEAASNIGQHGLMPDARLASEQARLDDPRLGVTVVARPPAHIFQAIRELQDEVAALVQATPSAKALSGALYWMAPPSFLHMTVVEWVSAEIGNAAQVRHVVDTLQGKGAEALDALTGLYAHTVCLVEPTVSFDAAAIAISFLPASSDAPEGAHDYAMYRTAKIKQVQDIAAKYGLPAPKPRYLLPSAHITVARVCRPLHENSSIPFLVEGLDRITRSWHERHGSSLRWPIHACQLEVMHGQVWYGGGQRTVISSNEGGIL